MKIPDPFDKVSLDAQRWHDEQQRKLDLKLGPIEPRKPLCHRHPHTSLLSNPSAIDIKALKWHEDQEQKRKTRQMMRDIAKGNFLL